jgi:hypothetical protein
MDCTCFRAAYDRWWGQGPVDNRYPAEQQDWFGHEQDCRECRDWARRRYCQYRGIQADQHCCLDMASAIAHPIETLHQGPNRVLDWIACWDEYRIPMSYDGYSATPIRHCPWCGHRLPDSKRSLWYERLKSLGYSDPGNEDLPDEFGTDEWWRSGKAVT